MGIIFNNIRGMSNVRIARTDKYDNDPYRDKVVLHCPFHNDFNDTTGKVYTNTYNTSIDTSNYIRNGGSLKSNNSFVSFPSATYMDLNQNFTMEFWANMYTDTTHPQNAHPIVSKYYDNNNTLASFNIYISRTSVIFQYRNTSTIVNNVSFPISTEYNIWNHYVIQRKNNVFELYFNGNKDPVSWNVYGTLVNPNLPLNIGAINGRTYYGSNSYISDLRITLGVARYEGRFIPQ